MKLAVTSDWHRDFATAGVPREREIDQYVENLERELRRHEVDWLFFLGDFCDPGKMHDCYHAARLIRYCAVLSSAVRIGSVWLAGNHDVVEAGHGATMLSPLAAAVVCGAFQNRQPNIYVRERPAFDYVKREQERVPHHALLTLPYCAAATRQQYETELHGALKGAGAWRLHNPTGALIVAGHCTRIPHAIRSNESEEYARGRDVDLPVDALMELRPTLVFNGHFHRAQTVVVQATPEYTLRVAIPGSPLRLNFGERNDEHKGYLLAEVP